ncbi:class I SAM-dependent methyltransferase [Candidatus Parcubacteria bacterium]|nr:class I SAM-dependent methyltransferase [Candidatus Parcubacteria bacterium]
MDETILTTKRTEGYELLDSGEGEKLERFGDFVLRRPDPQALWPKHLDVGDWRNAHFAFQTKGEKGEKGAWKFKVDLPVEWNVLFGANTFIIRPTAFKHTGLFPEQLPNWQWVRDVTKKAGRPISVLNLFAYTGGATLAAAAAGAEVCHVDASKTAVTWAKKNAEISGLGGKPVRWIVDEASQFVKKEIRRGKKYDAIIMDPPSFGRGPKGEVWKIEDGLLAILKDCYSLLSDKPLFFLINGYAAGYSPLMFKNNLEVLAEKYGGRVQSGELTILESAGRRLLPAGIFGRWASV